MCASLEEDYKLYEELGRGRFGVVRRCYSTAASQFLACKSINKLALSADPIDRRCVDSEPKILALLYGCPNILTLHAVHEDQCYLHLITDLCLGGDLNHRLSAGERFSEPEAASIFNQLMVAVACCHSLGVAHRDVKPDNILFDSAARVKLADFGSAELFLQGSTMTGIVGTPYYVAPEVVMGKDYTEKVDVWSAGVILYIMLAGFPPFYGDDPAEVFRAVIRGNLRFPPKVFRSVSPQAKDLLKKMLCKDVSGRLSSEQVLRHPWVTTMAEMEP